MYAIRYEGGKNKKRKCILMHRQIVGDIPDGKCIDHVNHYGLDNRRANLRVVTTRDNCINRRAKQFIYTSKYPGVLFDARWNKWQAHIGVGGKNHNLGRFTDEESAAQEYRRAYDEINAGLPLTRPCLRNNPFPGVSFFKRDKTWTARVCRNYLGRYETPEEAYQKVCEYRRKREMLS